MNTNYQTIAHAALRTAPSKNENDVSGTFLHKDEHVVGTSPANTPDKGSER